MAVPLGGLMLFGLISKKAHLVLSTFFLGILIYLFFALKRRLYDFEKEGIQVVPSARAVNFTMNRKAIRDLAAKELGLKTAKYFYAKSLDIVMITHNEEIAQLADRIIRIEDGRIIK